MSQLANSKLIRRTLSISFMVVAFFLGLAIAPFLLPILLLSDLVLSSRLARTRFALALMWVLLLEMFGLVASVVTLKPLLFFWMRDRRAVYKRWNQKLVIFWGRAVFAGVRAIYNLRLEVRGQEDVTHGPMLIFLRHSSVADVFLGNDLVAAPNHLNLRYAMKSQLMWEPCEDIVAPRVGSVFVVRNANNPAAEIDKIGSLGKNLGPNEGVLIYPEGTRYTPQKKQKILQKLREENKGAELAYAESLKHLLPPKMGGVMRLLSENQGADVVFCAHLGLENMTKIRHFWDGKIIGGTIYVQFWRIPFAEIPKSNEKQREFVLEQWKKLDDCVSKMIQSAPIT